MNELVGRLRSSSLFAKVDEATVRRFADGAIVRQFADGDAIWRSGDSATSFHIVQRGLVQIVKPQAGGEPATLGLFGPHESVGESAVLVRGTFPADAIAASDAVEILRVRAEPVLDAMDRNPELATAINRVLLEHTRALWAKIDVLSAGEVPARLATLLTHLSDRFGDETAEGTTFIPLTLSRSALARLVGARVETVIRVMSKWQKEGFVLTSPDGFEIRSAEELLASARRSS